MKLTPKMLTAIRAYEAEVKQPTSSYVRTYRWIQPLKSGEFAIYAIACKNKNTNNSDLVAKVVCRYFSHRNYYFCRDVGRSWWYNSWSFDFSQEHAGKKHWWSRSPDDDTWGKRKYDTKIEFRILGPYLNKEALVQTRYAKCGFFDKPANMDLLDYVRLWRRIPQIEFLQKAGLSRFIHESFISKLLSDKDFFNFFRSHAKELAANSRNTRPVFRIACKRRISFEDAAIIHELPYAKKKYSGIPSDLVTMQLFKWLKENKASLTEYERYCQYLAQAGEDPHAYGFTFPRNFREALEEMEKRANDIRAKKLAKERREFDKSIKRVHDTLAKICGKEYEGMICVIPKNVRDLIDEGNAMKNCIGRMGYDRRIAQGESIILFLRNSKGEPFVDVEIDRQRWKCRQCYGRTNSNPGDDAKRFAEKLCKEAKRIYAKLRETA